MMRFAKYYILLIVLLVALPLFTLAQLPQYEFKASVSKDTITIGDQIEFNILVALPKGYTFRFSAHTDTIAKGIEIVQPFRIDTLNTAADRTEYIYKLLITSFDSGVHRIAPQKIAFGASEPFDTVQTAAVWLTVKTVPRDTTVADIFDIKQPLDEPITFAEIAPWVGGTILLGALIFLLVLLIRRLLQRKPIVLFEKPKDPAHVVALRKLQLIFDSKRWFDDDYKAFHSEVTEIVREYIEGRFGIPALEQTTMDIVHSFQRDNVIPKALFDKFFENFATSDLVKFAKYSPSVSENESLLKFAFDFVNETKPVEEVPTNSEQRKDNDPDKMGITNSEKRVEL